MIEIWVEGHPASHARPRFGRGRVYMTSEYLDWRTTVSWTAAASCPEPLQGWLAVALHFVTSSWKKTDLDNLSKATLDGLNGVLFQDDRQVSSLYLSKSAPVGAEGVLIVAWEVPEPSAEWERFVADVVPLSNDKQENV